MGFLGPNVPGSVVDYCLPFFTDEKHLQFFSLQPRPITLSREVNIMRRQRVCEDGQRCPFDLWQLFVLFFYCLSMTMPLSTGPCTNVLGFFSSLMWRTRLVYTVPRPQLI